jgi:hypothetical protein
VVALPASSAAKATPDSPGIVTSDRSRSTLPSLADHSSRASAAFAATEDAVAPVGQDSLGQLADGLLVLHEEHRLGAVDGRLDSGDRGFFGVSEVGNVSKKRVPRPGSDSTEMSPDALRTMP